MNVFSLVNHHPTMIEPHWHDHFELIYVLHGDVTLHIGSTTYQTTSGDLIFVNSGEIHAAFTHSRLHKAVVHAILFHPSMIYSASSKSEYTAPYLSGKSIIATKIHHETLEYKPLMDTVLKLLNEFKHKHVGYKIALNACCQLLFTYLTRGYKVKTKKTRKSQLKAARFKELLILIEQSSAERIGLKEAASMVHMSPYHFCKTFKQ